MPRSDNASPTLALGVITVVLTLVGWSSVPLFLRHFAESIDFWTSNGWRYGFSALVWLPVLIVGRLKRSLPPGLWRAAFIPSIVNAAGQVCFTWAHYRIDPGLLTFGLRSQLLFVAIGAWLLFPKERAIIRTRSYLLGAGLLVAGMIGVIALDGAEGGNGGPAPHADPAAMTAQERDGSHAPHGASAAGEATSTHSDATAIGFERGTRAAHLEGVALAIFSGLLFACYGLAVRKYMDGINPVVAFAAICQYTAAALVALMLLFGDDAGWSVFVLGPDGFLVLLVSALIGIAIGHVFYYIAIARLGVAVTAGVLQLQPFLVAIGSLALFAEVLTPWQWVGGCVAVTGAMLMLSVQYRMSRHKPALEKPLAIAEGESGG